METEKSNYSSKNNLGSRSLLCPEEKPNNSKKTVKLIKNGTKESDLILFKHLRYSSKRNKSNDIDENTNLLKTQLVSQFGDNKTDKTYDCSSSKNIDSNSSHSQNLHSSKKLKPLILGSNLVESKDKCEDFNCFPTDNEKFKPVFVSTPAKFLKQMKEKTHTKIFIDDEGPNPKYLLLNTKPQEEIYQKVALTSQSNKFIVPLLPQQKIEELLYKSFIMLNFNSTFFLHNKSDSVLKQSAAKIRKEKFNKFKKQPKDGNSTFNQKNLDKYCRSSHIGKKRRKDSNSSLSDVEIINLENNLSSNVTSENNIICIDLDVGDYDWNDPFDLNNTEFPSEKEIIESCEKKEAAETQKLKFNNTDMLQSEINYCNDEKNKAQLKKVWECPVCFEQSKGQEVVATQCGHVFCKNCLESHFSKFGKSCPSCRTNLKNKPFITLFNF